MKNILNKFSLGFLTVTVAVLSLVFVQQQVWAAWIAPNVEPGDQSGVNTPLIPNDAGEVDLANNDIINVGALEVDTLTASTSLTVSGTLNSATLQASTFKTNTFNVPMPGVGYGTVNVTGTNSSISLTAANSALTAPSKAAYFIAGENAYSGSASYGVYAATNALSGANPNYAVAGVSNNAGGTAIYGLANDGWAGYFSGPVGIAGSLAVGNNTTASGAYSFAIGTDTNASGDHSFAGGDGSIASGFGATALGWNSVASGVQSLALGYSSRASAENSIALGSITVSALDSLGINLDSGLLAQTFSQANSMAIMGGNVGINTVTPGYRLHLIGDYYQDGMMQVRPTTALGSTENIFYADLPSGSHSSSNLLLLQNNGVDKFKVNSTGSATFAGSISATQGSFSSGLVVSGSTATITSGATVTGTLGMKSGGVISFNASKGSYFDFNDDDGTAAPTCAASTAGVVYNFKLNNVLCYCNGTSWFSMVNGKADSLCATK